MSEWGVERALVDLGRHLRFPETPDLALTVAERVSAVRPLAPIRRMPRRRMVVLAAAMLLLVVGGLAAFVPGVRATLVRIFTLGAVRIEVGAPPAPPTSLADHLDLGRQVPLGEARQTMRFPVRVPEQLGAPDAAYLDALPSGRIVWLAYDARPNLPAADETGLGALIGELRGTPEGEFVLKKLPFEGVDVEPVTVGDEGGFWLSGPPHQLFFLGPNGEFVEDRTRLAGNTLVWEDDGITYRLESALDREESIALAESFR